VANTLGKRAFGDLVVLAIAILVPSWFVWTCRPRDAHIVEYVVPTGFRGLLAIVESPHGTSIQRADRSYRVEFPSSGILLVQSGDFEAQWAERTWRFADGQSIPFHAFYWELEKVDADEVIAFGFGSMSRNHGPSVFATAICARVEVQQLRREWDAGDLYARAVAAAADKR
jgi:hypothetical protein